MTVTASGYERQRNELYETAYWAAEVALKHLPPLVGRTVWEPAAGNHRIADTCTLAGATVITSDIETYDREHDGIYNYLDGEPPMFAWTADDIITNPPYGDGNRQAAAFVRMALATCNGWIAMLLTAKFDWGSTRVDMFRDCARFHKKVVLIDRIKFFDGPGTTGGTEDHAWYIWRPDMHADTFRRTPPVIAYEGNPYK